ncbi:MAG: hypothetical protein JRI23_30965 [Deltaproteobacteria bacterium]|jgi:hypothetical protein|nr:hypothetical protein [Deltaproteobacteria bacterium]MBW2536623.1 hypothetical protein [Deltaproteobacteria bacterium]
MSKRLTGWGRWLAAAIGGALLVVPGCGDDDLYGPCDSPADCSPPPETEAACVDKGGEGFCTWYCSGDGDCDVDVDDDYRYVCASFEDNPDMYCFPSCESGGCPGGMECRSTGGGADNRKICFPS